MCQRRGNGEAKHTAEIGYAEGRIFEGESAISVLMYQTPNDKECANDLRSYGRDRNGCDLIGHDKTKNDVQNDIDRARNNGVHQRTTAIAFRADDRRTEIINKERGSAAHIDSQIDHRTIKAIRRATQRMQKRNGNDVTDHSNKNTTHERKIDRGIHDLFDTGLITRADRLREQNARAKGKRDKALNHKADDISGRTDRSNGSGIRHISEDDHIRRMEKILNDGRDHDRYRKTNDRFPKRTFGDIFFIVCHIRFSPHIDKRLNIIRYLNHYSTFLCRLQWISPKKHPKSIRLWSA